MTFRLINNLRSFRPINISSNLQGLFKPNAKNTLNSFLFKNEFHLTSIDLAEPIRLKMPALSPTMTEGQIIKWHKKEGDKVSPGDVLFEVQTDKAVMGYELEEEGTIAKIFVNEGAQTVQVGSLIGLLVLPGEDWKNVSVSDIQENKPTQSKVEANTPAVPAAQEQGHHHEHGM